VCEEDAAHYIVSISWQKYIIRQGNAFLLGLVCLMMKGRLCFTVLEGLGRA